MSEDLLVDGYDYNPHTCMVEVPYNDYYDMKDKCKENKQLKSQLQQEENILKEAREYITSYESISIIQSLEDADKNKILDDKTMLVMTNRYLKVHDKLLEILDKANDREDK